MFSREMRIAGFDNELWASRELTGWMCDILDDLDNAAVIDRVRGQVAELCARFPVYG